MTVFPGDELYNYLLRHGSLPVEKVKRIFTQLVGAVAYVHSKSCVHRDLKLENILLDKQENVKLCDFGFTREYEGKASYLQTFCGTICYSAPEMLKGEKYAGEKVDVWSLGIILYALLAGELPYDDDDDQVTKRRILSEEPTYSDRFTDDAKALVNLLLSKRPLIRPSLDEILAHPFLAENAPEQLAILKIPRPSPFTTPLEKTTLQRMKSAGVNINEVMENVLAQRCDPLAGWWALLIEKEQRKEHKREQRRREREVEAKNLRRLSAASSRLEKRSSALMEVEEEGQNSTSQARGRRDRRSLPSQLAVPELPALPEPLPLSPVEVTTPPLPIDKDSIRSHGSTRRRPVPPPKDKRRSRPSMLHMSASQPELTQREGIFRRRTSRRHHNSILSQLATLKHWFVESAKRARSPHSKSGGSRKFTPDKISSTKIQGNGKKPAALASPTSETTGEEVQTPTQTNRFSTASSLAPSSASYRQNRHSYPRQPLNANHASHRNSLSPSPITPRGSYRRSSAGLRGRKSTSSSVSSIRSMHHTRAHSRASSISSNSNADTISTPSGRASKSPHSSLKVLPTTPGSYRFPSNIRLVRGSGAPREGGSRAGSMSSSFNEAAPQPLMYSPSSSLVFARRKRSAFKGPMIHTTNLVVSGAELGSPTPGQAGASNPGASAGRPVARKSQIIEEEFDDDTEEVDAFEDPGTPGTLSDMATSNERDETQPAPPTMDFLSRTPIPFVSSMGPTPPPPRSSSLRSPAKTD